jgi:hypothetical protein
VKETMDERVIVADCLVDFGARVGRGAGSQLYATVLAGRLRRFARILIPTPELARSRELAGRFVGRRPFPGASAFLEQYASFERGEVPGFTVLPAPGVDPVRHGHGYLPGWAAEVGAEILVTYSGHLRELSNVGGVRIMSPAQCLAFVTDGRLPERIGPHGTRGPAAAAARSRRQRAQKAEAPSWQVRRPGNPGSRG